MNLINIPLLVFLTFASCTNSMNNDCCAKEIKNNESAIASQNKNGYAIGDIATNFKLKNVDGKIVSLSDYKDAKGFIVVFTATHCPFSKAYEDRINALDKKYKNKGFPVIAINPTNPEIYGADSYENMQILAKKKGFTFPFLLDVGQKIYPQYGATNTPHFFVLEKTRQGNKVAYIGAMDDNAQNTSAVQKRYVEDAVDALIAGKKPKITKTKAIGCGISR